MQIMAMRLRREKPGPVVDAFIVAYQSGIEVDLSDVEWAVAQGANMEKVLRLMPEALAAAPPEAVPQAVFQDLVNSEVDGQPGLRDGP